MSSSPERDETDIYGDLPNFQFDEAFKKLEEEKSELQNKVEELGTQLDVMKIQNDKLAAKVKSLGKNISCLYKTAQRELERKEQIIADLRKERDDLLFRRGLKEDKLSNRRRPSRKQLTPTKKVSNGNLKRIQEAKVKNGGSSPITLISLDSEDPERKDYDKNEPKEMKIPEISNEPSNVNVDHNLRKEDTSNSNVSTEKIVQEEAVSSVEKRDISATPANDTEKEKPLCTESAVKTPAVTPIKEEKFTVHMSSEDCGFGQRRRIRRVLKSSATVTVAAQASTAPKAETITSATPKAYTWNITSAEEKGVKRPLECWKKLDMIEMEPIVIKRSRLDYNVPPRHHDDKAVETSNVSNSADIIGVKNVSEVCMKNSDDNSLETVNVALPVENCSSVCNKNSSSSLSDQNVDMEKDPRKEDSHLPKIDDNERAQDLLKKYGTSFGVSAYPNDNQDSGVENSASGDVRNPSCQDEIKSTPLSKHYKINSESKNRTFSNNEGCNSSKLTNYLSDRLEDNRSKDNFSNASPSSSSPSHSCQSEHRHASPIIPQNEKPSGDGNFKRSRSWERERVSYCDLNDFSDTDRKGRHSERDGKLGDPGREGYKRDVYRGKFSSRDRNRDSGRSGNSDRGRDIDSGDHDRGRENNRIREVDRRRDHNRDRELVRGRNIDRGKDSNRLRDSDRDRDCDRNRDLDRVRELNRGRDQGRDRDYDRGQDADRSWNADHGRDIDRGRNRSRDRDRSKELERSRDGDQSRDRDRSRERDRDRSRERDRDRSRERDRDRSRERDRDRSRERDRDRSRERDRDRSRERNRDRSRERDRDRSRERERGRDQIRYRDQHRIRVNEKRDASDSSRKYSNEPRDADTTDRKTKGVSGGSRGGRGNWNGYRDRDRPQNEAEDTTEKWCEKRNMNQDKLKTRTQELSSSDNTPANDKSPNNPVEPPEWD